MTYKRMEEGSFVWPSIKDGIMHVSMAQFEALFEGLDWRRIQAKKLCKPVAAE